MKDQAARLLRLAQKRPDHKARLACSYGCHDFVHGKPYPGMKECTVCGATYWEP